MTMIRCITAIRSRQCDLFCLGLSPPCDGPLCADCVETPGIRRASPEIAAALAAGRDIDPSLYYFRVTPQFFVTDEKYAWLQQSLFIGLGAKQPKGVEIEVFALT
jgi:hypothetical protein